MWPLVATLARGRNTDLGCNKTTDTDMVLGSSGSQMSQWLQMAARATHVSIALATK